MRRLNRFRALCCRDPSVQILTLDFLDITSAPHQLDISPTLARHQPHISYTLARHQPHISSTSGPGEIDNDFGERSENESEFESESTESIGLSSETEASDSWSQL